MSNLEQILKDGKFTVNGIEYDVDHASTNNDPANHRGIQRLHGIGPDGHMHVPPDMAEVADTTPPPVEPQDEPVAEVTASTDTVEVPDQPVEPTVEADSEPQPDANPEQAQPDQPAGMDVDPIIPAPEPTTEVPPKKSRSKSKQ